MTTTQEIEALRNILENTESSDDELINVIEQLGKKEITVEIIKETKIGLAVGKLRKHKNGIIASKSNVLVDKWKQIVGKGNKTSEAPQEVKLESTPPPVKKEANGKEVKDIEVKSEEKKRKVEKEEETTKKKAKKEVVDEPKSPTDLVERMKQKAVQMLKEAIGSSSDYILEPEEVAKEIEREITKLFPDIVAPKTQTSKYKSKLMSLCFNLKNPKNPDLRASLMNGALTVERLCTMQYSEMASGDLKEIRKKYEQYHLEAAKLIQMNQTSTDMFKCSKCQGRTTTYYQLQTRSADEPMTTFHTCTKCGHRWKS